VSEKTHERPLGFWSATGAVIATMIGAGIFGATGGFAHELGTDTNVLLVWLFCGGLALTGALSLGELGAMMPRSGGCYTYNRHLYGDTAGYLSGVLSFLLAFVGAAAFITLLLGVYVQEIIPGIPPAATASAVILVFTLIHCIGLREGNYVNNFFTIFKVGVILAFIVAGFQANVEPTVNPAAANPGVFSAPFASAMLTASFAYLGWETSSWIAGDIRDPKRNLPRSLIAGTVFVTVLYLLLNTVFLRAQSASTMTGEIESIGLHATKILFSPAASQWFNWMVVVLLISTVLGRPSPTHAPQNALILQAVLTLIFIFAANNKDSVDTVLTFIGLPLTLIMGATVAGVFVLRLREPKTERPFRVPLYPVTPLIFLGLSIWMVVSAIAQGWKTAAASAVTILIVWALKPVLTGGATSTSPDSSQNH
jgi:APA family basic amino acid/polyamine antiporter